MGKYKTYEINMSITKFIYAAGKPRDMKVIAGLHQMKKLYLFMLKT